MEPNNSPIFFESVLNSLTEQLAVIDASGLIVFVNQSWIIFSKENGGGDIDWTTVNYLNCCELSAEDGDADSIKVNQGIKQVIAQEQSTFIHEYPCHSPTEQRWFLMRMSSLHCDNRDYFIITHQDITTRKLAEQKIEALASQDSLTLIANRRRFDEFSNERWRLNMREGTPISIAMVDIDHFKEINDTYGHSFGDNCLIALSSTLSEMVRRPNELCARLGGDEFIIIWGNTSQEQAKKRAEEIIIQIRKLPLGDDFHTKYAHLSVSIGCTSMIPSMQSSLKKLIKKADDNLYLAKESGRNKIVFK